MPHPSPDPLPGSTRAKLNGMLERLADGRGVRHAVLAVGRSDGSPLWLGAAGKADEPGTPLTPRTPYFLASVTKLYIATAMLRLMEQGRVSLDNAMTAYLPRELVERLHVWKGRDRTGEITLRHLLGHATGLPDYLVIRPPEGMSLFDAAASGQTGGWGIEEIADLVRAHGSPEFPPRPFDGRRHRIRYSDTNFQLLIAIIETVTGTTLQDAFEELIFRRLGLVRTFLPATTAAAAVGPAPAAVWLEDRRLDPDEPAMISFNDLFSTAEEQLRFMATLVSGDAFDNPATARLMTAHWNPLAFSLNPRPVGPGWPMEYGLGMIRYKLPRILTPFRPMPAVVGHTGVSGSWLFHCPELGVITAGTVSQATAAATPYRLMPRLLAALQG
jgi:CubicO group peptidase (beta-lactamase class C family)